MRTPMNLSDRYARLAETHMRTYLPARYHQIDDPETYFNQLGEQIAAQVFSLEVTLAAAEPAAEDFMVRAGHLRAARMRAEEIVFSDLVYLPPELPDPDQPNLEVDETGAYTGWTDPIAKEIWGPGPSGQEQDDREGWEAEMWAKGLDPATGQPMFSDTEIEEKARQAQALRAQERRADSGSATTGPSG
jgi:diadenosine tetraphosphatase ApaH/serine/threonine PP2A family protein phosphatase